MAYRPEFENNNEIPDLFHFFDHLATKVCSTRYLLLAAYFCYSFVYTVMKKILIGLVVLLAVALIGVYLFIPAKTKIGAAIQLQVALPGVSRTLLDENNWKKWWPDETPFNYNKQTYSIRGKIFNVFDIDIYNDKDTINSQMELVLLKANTMTILWEAEQVSSSNPFKRWVQYRHAKATEKNINDILQSMKAFLQKKRKYLRI